MPYAHVSATMSNERSTTPKDDAFPLEKQPKVDHVDVIYDE
jgi:hypothetical protein